MTRQTDEKSLYEQQEDRILAQSDAFISLLTKRGILGDHEIDNEKIRTAQQKKRQTSYHNTKMLLQHYRTIAWVLECFPTDVAAELDTPFEHIDQLIDKVDMEMAMGNRKLEGRMDTAEGGITAINGKIGTVESGKTVVEMIADAKTATADALEDAKEYAD